jgi:hypothetical protein
VIRYSAKYTGANWTTMGVFPQYTAGVARERFAQFIGAVQNGLGVDYTYGTSNSYAGFQYALMGTNSAAIQYGGGEIYIPRYKTTDYGKTMLGQMSSAYDVNGGGTSTIVHSIMWVQGTAISQIQISSVGGSLKATSTFSLYGIKNT